MAAARIGASLRLIRLAALSTAFAGGSSTINSVKWGTFVQRQLLVNRAPVLMLWAVVGEVLGGQRQRQKMQRGVRSILFASGIY